MLEKGKYRHVKPIPRMDRAKRLRIQLLFTPHNKAGSFPKTTAVSEFVSNHLTHLVTSGSCVQRQASHGRFQVGFYPLSVDKLKVEELLRKVSGLMKKLETRFRAWLSHPGRWIGCFRAWLAHPGRWISCFRAWLIHPRRWMGCFRAMLPHSTYFYVRYSAMPSFPTH